MHQGAHFEKSETFTSSESPAPVGVLVPPYDLVGPIVRYVFGSQYVPLNINPHGSFLRNRTHLKPAGVVSICGQF